MSSVRCPSSEAFSSWFAPAVLALWALACSEAATSPAGPADVADLDDVTGVSTTESAASPSRAFKMHGTVLLVSPVVPPPAPCFALLNSVIEGHATHLGRFSGTGSTCILVDLPNTPPDPDPPFTPAGPGPYVTVPFTNPLWVLTAANGDELWLEADDAVAVISAMDGSLAAAGTHTIVGGTGRFANAMGETQTSARNDDGAGPDDMESEGWISY